MAENVTIDGKDYVFDDLPDKAKKDMVALRTVDQKIEQNKQELAILQTARNAYARSLSQQLPVAKQ